MVKLYILAQEALDDLEHVARDEAKPDEKYWRRKGEGYKEDWIRDLIRTAHDNGNTTPNDVTYDFIVDALQSIAAGDDDTDDDDLDQLEFEIEADVYNNDLLTWVSSNLARAGYCDEAIREQKPGTFWEILQMAQLLEKQEVFRSVLDSLRDEQNERGESEDDEAADEATTV